MSKNKELKSKNSERSEVVKDADGFYPYQWRGTEEEFVKHCGLTMEEYNIRINAINNVNRYLDEKFRKEMVENKFQGINKCQKTKNWYQKI
jgi:hypothetical protein